SACATCRHDATFCGLDLDGAPVRDVAGPGEVLGGGRRGDAGNDEERSCEPSVSHGASSGSWYGQRLRGWRSSIDPPNDSRLMRAPPLPIVNVSRRRESS